MKRSKGYIVPILLILILSGCSIKKYCQENYPPNTFIKDSIITVISYECEYDTIPIPFESVHFDTVFLPPGITFHKEKSNGRTTGSVSIKDGKLSFKCEADSLQHVIEVQKKIITTLSSQTKIVTPPPVYINYWYHVPLIWYFFITLLLAIIYLIRVIIKIYTRS